MEIITLEKLIPTAGVGIEINSSDASEKMNPMQRDWGISERIQRILLAWGDSKHHIPILNADCSTTKKQENKHAVDLSTWKQSEWHEKLQKKSMLRHLLARIWSGIVLLLQSKDQKAMIQPDQNTSMESAILGNGSLVLAWDLSSNYPFRKVSTQIRMPW